MLLLAVKAYLQLLFLDYGQCQQACAKHHLLYWVCFVSGWANTVQPASFLNEFIVRAYWDWILQSELESVSEDDAAMPPGTQPHQRQVSVQHQQQAVAGLAGSVGTSVPGQTEAAPLDQSKNSFFTGALASSIGQDLPALGMSPAGYRVPSNSGHLGRRTGMISEQHADLAWEEEPGVAPYHDASGTAGFGFHPIQQQQQGRDGNSFTENDASMDMHGSGVADEYFGWHHFGGEQSTGSIATFAFVYWHPLKDGFGTMKDHL
jgi:hypothetical protein